MKANSTCNRKHGGRWGFLVLAAAAAIGVFICGILIRPIDSDARSRIILPSEVFDEVNEVREYYGLDDLTWDETLADCAKIRARESEKYFSHKRPDGSAWYTVNPAVMEGENLLWTSRDRNETEIVTLWMNSRSHRALILDRGYETMGVAGYTNPAGVHYWVIEFGY